MAFWNNVNYPAKVLNVSFGKGINSYNEPVSLDDNELTDSLNMCSDDYPAIRVRNDRTLTTAPQLTGTLYGIGQRSNAYLHVLSSNTWAYCPTSGGAWTDVSTTITTPGKANFIEFNTQTAKYTIMAHAGGVFNNYWDGATLSTFTDTNCPKTNLFTAHRYRLYGVSTDGRTLRYSAQGSIVDWTTANDAGYMDITELKGTAIAITTYADHVIVWGKNSMHEVYGTGPDNFELVNISNIVGIVSRNSYVEREGMLFWMDKSGIFQYTGGLPRQIAHKVSGIIDRINWANATAIAGIYAGSKGGKIYFAVPLDGSSSNNYLIVIDIIEGKGNIYTINLENGNFVGFSNADDELYGLRSDGYIYNMHSDNKTGDDNSTAIVWSFETKAFSPLIDQEFAVQDIFIEHQGTTKATMLLGYTTDSDSTTYTSLAVSVDFQHTTDKVRSRVWPSMTDLQGQSFMKFKFSGTGYKKISRARFKVISYGDVV